MSDESIYYESGKHRIEVLKSGVWFFWRKDTDALTDEEFNYGPWRGMNDDLNDLLFDSAGECLEVDDPDWTVAKNQRAL